MGKQAIVKFWTWFQANEEKLSLFEALPEVRQARLMDALLSRLQRIDEGLFFEFSANEGSNELIITAEGNLRLFNLVDDIVDSGPDLDNWHFFSLKPAQKASFTTQFEDIFLSPSEMWFLPFENSKIPNKVGLRIGITHFDQVQTSKWLGPAVNKVVETVIGERSLALDVEFIEVGKVPQRPEEQGYIELTELQDYILWKKSSS